MRKKLTLVGVLTALVFGAVVVAGDVSKTFAGAGPNQIPVQNFAVSNDICYGSHPSDGTQVCPGASASTAPASSSATQYTNVKLPHGSRLTLPITYTPSDFGFTAGSGTVGSVTAISDILCNGVNDVLSAGGPPGTNANDPNAASGSESALELGNWPKPTVWLPYPVVHQGTTPAGPDAYVNDILPTPPTFTNNSHDRSDFYTLWLGGASTIDLYTNNGGAPTPLNIVVQTSPYTTGLRTSVALLAGNPSPPTNSFSLCLDSPQNSVAANTQVTTPAAPGLYARWTMFTSAIDLRHWTVSRLVDLACVNVGAAVVTDGDGDCLVAGSDSNDGNPDVDGDQLADGIEVEFGTSATVPDTDGDGADDFTEMAQFTRAMEGGPGFVADCAPVADPDGAGPEIGVDSAFNNADDTDCDGQRDLPDNGADETVSSKNVLDDTNIDDNCPVNYNAAQINSDSGKVPNFIAGAAGGDLSVNDQDLDGNACDTDNDNDGFNDVAEAVADVGLTPNFCAIDAGGANLGTSTSDFDSDNDLALDGLECKFTSNPMAATSRAVTTTSDFLTNGDLGSQETFYRTQLINIPGGGQNNNLDAPADANCGGGPPVCATEDTDTDDDRLLDGVEVIFYGSVPSNDDTDGDGCKDGIEAADVNGDRTINVLDLSAVATRSASTPFAGGRYRDLPSGTGAYTTVDYVTLDFNRDGSLTVTDLSAIAFIDSLGAAGDCGGVTPGAAQGGVTVTNDDDGVAP